jgi:hypothetical protein
VQTEQLYGPKGSPVLAAKEDMYQPELNEHCVSQMFKTTLVTAFDNSYCTSIEEDDRF